MESVEVQKGLLLLGKKFKVTSSPINGSQILVFRDVYCHLERRFRKCCTHFLYTSWLLLKHLLVARGKTKDRFCIFPAISIIKHWTCDDILRICAVWRLIRFAQSTISIHKCIQTCQFVSSFCAPSRELAHNRLVECVQLICPFV